MKNTSPSKTDKGLDTTNTYFLRYGVETLPFCVVQEWTGEIIDQKLRSVT